MPASKCTATPPPKINVKKARLTKDPKERSNTLSEVSELSKHVSNLDVLHSKVCDHSNKDDVAPETNTCLFLETKTKELTPTVASVGDKELVESKNIPSKKVDTHLITEDAKPRNATEELTVNVAIDLDVGTTLELYPFTNVYNVCVAFKDKSEMDIYPACCLKEGNIVLTEVHIKHYKPKVSALQNVAAKSNTSHSRQATMWSTWNVQL
ncbi:hypothetical protein SERLADRAFT_404620 [Serpula lacrymans var. lacrymans S7.9]|uniref:Uncharacterized protein n=1 Tax=Serpula lacrymans var. lacrymans (strain S7.9) TaxID=578457 RepID=F8NE78_SERL9|nr:uncharacterized protein SERLADRAFT_404620 [Serpula lacrymans var. lacrymans S7.9]EGO30460.1 hypothetical protein SERLADRAFT_404620 [Serpula lacrymans var. lacrymans S7.9]